MVVTTKKIVQGHYHQRFAPSQIQELNDLAHAFNYLIEQLEAQLVQLNHLAFHDYLTHLPNRAFFMDSLDKALARASRSGGKLAVLFIDLDGFKQVNDTLGHKAGDQLLITVSDRLQQCLRSGDTLARLGGDEFTILLENILDINDATKVSERIAEILENPIALEEQEVLISASIGIACNSGNQSSADHFLRNADMAMYEAKKAGKAHHKVFENRQD